MRVLYHWSFDPASRCARIALSEAGLKFSMEEILPWAPDPDFLRQCIESLPPALIVNDPAGKHMLAGAYAICEFAADLAKTPLLPSTALERAEARRVFDWFCGRFAVDVNGPILSERIERVIQKAGHPDTDVLRGGRGKLAFHLKYLSWLLTKRDWLAGNAFTIADIAGAAFLSVHDYIGEIQWDEWQELKLWYERVKSRPSMRPLLSDRIAGMKPAHHYALLDF